MKTLAFISRQPARYLFTQSILCPIKNCIKPVIAASILLFAGNAYAVIDVGLAIENELDLNGNITVINGGKVKVAYTVIQDDDKDLNKKDKIQLMRVSDDSIVASVERGKKKTGTVSIKVKNSEGEQLYVRYVRKTGTQITRTSHPSDGGSTPLFSIAKASLADLTIEQNALKNALFTGSVVIPYYEFEPWWGNATECIRGSFGNSYYYYDTATTRSNCDAFAPLHLPDGATIINLSCRVWDNAVSTSLDASIVTRGPALAATDFITPASSDSASIQTISDTGTHIVDNGSRGYFIFMNSGSSNTVGPDLRIYDCTVTFTGP